MKASFVNTVESGLMRVSFQFVGVINGRREYLEEKRCFLEGTDRHAG